MDSQQISYHNTNAEEGIVLAISIKKAKGQETAIMKAFENNPNENLSPEDVFEMVYAGKENAPPITSVRRAITNLTSQGKLIKTHIMKSGMYNKQIFTWRLKFNDNLFDL